MKRTVETAAITLAEGLQEDDTVRLWKTYTRKEIKQNISPTDTAGYYSVIGLLNKHTQLLVWIDYLLGFEKPCLWYGFCSEDHRNLDDIRARFPGSKTHILNRPAYSEQDEKVVFKHPPKQVWLRGPIYERYPSTHYFGIFDVRPTGRPSDRINVSRAVKFIVTAIRPQPFVANRLNAPEMALKLIKARRGQPQFRKKLLRAYQNKCAVTGSPVVELLEACHISRHVNESSNIVPNGLLLRSDIHALFDLKLLSVDQGVIRVSARALPEYAMFNGKALRLPQETTSHPDPDLLKKHFKEARKYL